MVAYNRMRCLEGQTVFRARLQAKRMPGIALLQACVQMHSPKPRQHLLYTRQQRIVSKVLARKHKLPDDIRALQNVKQVSLNRVRQEISHHYARDCKKIPVPSGSLIIF